jgi:hypothetical protein
MAITGAWAERASIQAGATRQGTGWNPVHRQRDGGGRNTAPGGSEPAPDEIVGVDVFGYTDEDTASMLYGYGEQTGTADRPRVTEEPGSRHAVQKGWPQWGRYRAGMPGGTTIRAQDHGADLTYMPRDPMLHNAFAGWDNKLVSRVNDAVPSDPAQYTMTTSMVQRDKVLEGSQASGRASQYAAPIASRITPMKVKPFTGAPERHNAMAPKEQTFRIRPFWIRNAGTGPVAYSKSNAAHEQKALTRNPPGDASQGPILSGDSGYSYEDPFYA